MTIVGLFGTVIGLSFWLGSVVFLWFIVTPAMSKRLVPGKMAEMMGIINPRYYIVSYVCGFLMLFGSLGALPNPSTRLNTIAFMCFTAVALSLSLYAGLVVAPRSIDLRERLQSSAGSEENVMIRERFDHMNRLSMFFNGLVIMLLMGAALCLSAMLSTAQVVEKG